MKYQDLGGPTPQNYRPDDNSAKLDLNTRKKVDMVCSVFRRKWRREREKEVQEMQNKLLQLGDSMVLDEGKKKKRVKSKRPSDGNGSNTVEIGSEPSSPEKENLIMVGGIAGYNEQVGTRMKSYREFSDEVRNALNLSEKKNRGKKRTKNPSTTGTDERSKKIREVKNNDGLWSGLE